MRFKQSDNWIKAAQKHYDESSKDKVSKKRFEKFKTAYQKIFSILPMSLKTYVVDFGCGCGEMASAMKSKIGFYCGIDVSSDSLHIAKKRCPDSFFVCGDIAERCISERFDVSLAMTSLEFCQDKLSALRCIEQSLKDNGKFYMEVRNADFILFKFIAPFHNLLVRRKIVVPYKAEGFKDLGMEEWKTLLTQTGFKIIKIRPSLRPVFYGNRMTDIKNLIIKTVSVIMPIKWHYMIGFMCCKRCIQ